MRHIRTTLVDKATGEIVGHARVAPNAEPAVLDALAAMATHIQARASLGLPITNDEYARGTPMQKAHWDRVWNEWQESQGDDACIS